MTFPSPSSSLATALLVCALAACGTTTFGVASSDAGTTDGAHPSDATKGSDSAPTSDASTEASRGPDALASGETGAKEASAKDAGVDTSLETGAKEASAKDAGVDTSIGDAAEVCVPLTSPATDVYVNQMYPIRSNCGAATCPCSTILEGLVPAAALLPGGTKVTIHVKGSAGGTPAVYNETGAITLPPKTTLLGDDGSANTTISVAGAAMCLDAPCAVHVSGNAVLDGFTVDSPAGNGIETGPDLTPTVKNVVVTGALNNGIIVYGNLDLGPSVTASNNKENGVEVVKTATGTLTISGAPTPPGASNAFDNNMGNGINIDGSETLMIIGGIGGTTANGNGQGVRFGPIPNVGLNVITGLVANMNTGPGGIVAYGGQQLQLRSCTLHENQVGLAYTFVPGKGSIDLGNATSTGGNDFGSGMGSENTLAGVRICGGTMPGTVTAFSNTWPHCTPFTQNPQACDGGISVVGSGQDVLYDPATPSPGPVTLVADGGCY